MSADDHDMRRECAEFFIEMKGDTKAIAKDVAEIKEAAKALALAEEDRHAQVMHVFNGTPSDPAKPGFVVRIDRIENNQRWMIRGVVATIGGVLSLAAKATYHWITDK